MERTPLTRISHENIGFFRDIPAANITPIKKHVLSLTARLERADAMNVVLERENREFRRYRGTAQSTRGGITVKNIGTHHFNSEEGLARVLQEERASKRRKGKGKEVAPYVASG